MQDELFKILKEKFNIEVYEIKYVDKNEGARDISKKSGYKCFADFALSILKNNKQ